MQNGHLATQHGRAGREKRGVTQLEDLHSWVNPVIQPLSDLLKQKKKALSPPCTVCLEYLVDLDMPLLRVALPTNGGRARSFLGKHLFTLKEHPLILPAYLSGAGSAKQARLCRVGDRLTGTLCNDISVCTKSLLPFFPFRTGLKNECLQTNMKAAV